MSLYTPIKSCLACGSTSLLPVMDLGDVPLADFPKPGDDVQYAPLALQRCPRCDLVMLSHKVSRDYLYRHYFYTSGLNEKMVGALRDVVADALGRVDLRIGDVVLDVGANDGTLLLQYPDGVQRFGFDPSDVAMVASHGKTPRWTLYPEYFPPAGPWREYLPAPAKVITALAMFYDVDQPIAFLRSIADCLDSDGLFVLQMPSLRTMLNQNAVDNVCHEHIAYWPTHTLLQCAHAAGLQCVGLSRNDTNGGSERYYFRHATRRAPEWGGVEYDFGRELDAFVVRSYDNKVATRRFLEALAAKGIPVWAYGASTKGVTLLHYYGIDSDLIVAAADRNPEKWGREIAGIPIVSEDEFRRAAPPYALMLPWGFADAFVLREHEWLEGGGEFIQPLPQLKTLGGAALGKLQSSIASPATRDAVPSRHDRREDHGLLGRDGVARVH